MSGLSSQELQAILEKQVAEYEKQGWKLLTWGSPASRVTWLRQRIGPDYGPYMALWVEDDGTIKADFVGEGANPRD